MDLTAGSSEACAIDLQWPADEIGTWEVVCTTCGVGVSLTAASRPDDPRRVMLACGRPPEAHAALRRPWNEGDATPTRTE